ncbi:MAG TPA: FAA hydrolase family protein [Oceanospirillales bacterium]|nr:FAA hydrolase family protein [Oceanospirillales bacterium]
MNTVKFKQEKITPSKVICIGRNYVEHIQELNNETPEGMVVFCKPNAAISDDLFYIDENARFEGEICFVVKDKKLAGVGFGLDLTKADIQNKMKQKGLPWERAKAFNHSAVLSEFVEFSGDLTKLSMALHINERLVQKANYDLMIYKPQQIIKEIDSFMHLEDGDIIMTGTPKGVSTYHVNDTFNGRIFYDGDLIVEARWQVRQQ